MNTLAACPIARPSQLDQHADRAATKSFATRAVHAGREDFEALGVHAPPLDFSSTYPVHDLDLAVDSFDALVAGHAVAGNAVYSRLHNPTVYRFEQALAELENAEASVAFSSGMAAITALLLAVRASGCSHIVAVRPLYGGTDHLLSSELLGLATDFVDADQVATALRPETGLVLVETPGNPTLALVDIAEIVRQAGTVPVAVDSTFATPFLQQPLALGATFAVHSATKFLGGHGDVLAGVIATSEAWASRLRQVRILTGAVLHPLAGYLLHRGLPTLAARVRLAQDGAKFLAQRLLESPHVDKVDYPGLPGADPRRLIGRQMKGPGAILAFEVKGGLEAARRLLANLKLITPAVSLGSTDTLIQHPASLTHRLVDPAVRAAQGISDGLLRLSVGLEDPVDLWVDLEAALDDKKRTSAASIARASSEPITHESRTQSGHHPS